MIEPKAAVYVYQGMTFAQAVELIERRGVPDSGPEQGEPIAPEGRSS
jgi:hypothetical protein